MTEVPANKLIKDVLDGLLGKDVAVSPSALTLSSSDTVGSMIACYHDDDGMLKAVLGWSLPAGAHVAAALGLVPKPAVQDMISERFLRSDLAENLGEVCNVLASTFEHQGNEHVRLTTVYCPANTTPSALANLLYSNANRADLVIDVPGYGAGVLGIVGCN
ncbi:hypothetical protein M6D93_06125 [Jatrophihabitans telluris]|uniref:Chemotaxis protein CheX n=1 Tax=Jatrophihabitans telluris TaxID=2038343 RepID=A0ABY4R368_9ACTN|nr:hypothetical protein [Jatrophihabitans telluris]UQX89580.1 hypothetical protein M6D93_06125 [Jatrophihabitans telluris]